MDSKFAYIYNLPGSSSKSQVEKTLANYFKCDLICLFRYHTSFGIIDFKSAVIEFENIIPIKSQTDYIKKKILIDGVEAKLDFTYPISLLSTKFMFFNINPNELQALLDDIMDTSTFTFNEVTGQCVPITTVTVDNRETFIKAINNFDKVEWQPFIPSSNHFVINNKEFDKLLSFSPIHDFKIKYKDKEYGLIKSIAGQVSKEINQSKTNHISLPSVDGPIDQVVGFLWGKNISVQFENIPFLYVMANTLKIDALRAQIFDFMKSKMNILSVPSLCCLADFEGLEDDIYFELLHENFTNIADHIDSTHCIPYGYMAKIISSKSVKVSKDVLFDIIVKLDLENEKKLSLVNKLTKERKFTPSENQKEILSNLK